MFHWWKIIIGPKKAFQCHSENKLSLNSWWPWEVTRGTFDLSRGLWLHMVKSVREADWSVDTTWYQLSNHLCALWLSDGQLESASGTEWVTSLQWYWCQRRESWLYAVKSIRKRDRHSGVTQCNPLDPGKASSVWGSLISAIIRTALKSIAVEMILV